MKHHLQSLAKTKAKTQMLEAFALYEQILLRENAKYNLTAITDPEEIKQKHFADSMAILQIPELTPHLQPGHCLLDIGSGAGFPGVPLKIARPDLHVVLLEASAKKCAFLQMLANELKLAAPDGKLARLAETRTGPRAGLEVHNARAEQAAHNPDLREQFHVVTSRAVATLPVLCEWCLPFVQLGGVFVAYKGTRERTQEELTQAENAIKLLGGELSQIVSRETISGERTFVIIKKIAKTPPEYPRENRLIKSKPL
ncbi:MAG: 16S rRNA (guanine(527)-N(7))-methyltransferase RsmG [Oscillospiraceae bacterium]|nr:16S rRNA (guanine(527)-N(7))-methyltransferase RsmG [Oscillospiraceae bacterium]